MRAPDSLFKKKGENKLLCDRKLKLGEKEKFPGHLNQLNPEEEWENASAFGGWGQQQKYGRGDLLLSQPINQS